MNRLPRLSIALAALALAAPVAPVAANELGAADAASGIVVHDAAETMRDYCRWENGTLWFELPGGTRWELVTSIADPAISNPGDGAFHPFDAGEVRAAIAGVRYPLARISADVFVLPYPRRLGLDSGAGPGLILLSPGVRPIATTQQHAEVTHELGHVVQYTLMPDQDEAHWSEYRRLRGIANTATYCANAAHVDRPHEIFAEDFRALFGDAQAVAAGTIENADLAYPTAVAGLGTFVEALAGAAPIATPLRAAVASATSVRFSRGGTAVAALDLFDLGGRRIATLEPVADANGCTWRWDGRDASGARVAAGVLWARVRDGVGGTAKFAR